MTASESPWLRPLRDKVVRAGITHIVVAWLFLQVADVVLPYLGIVEEPVRWALVVSKLVLARQNHCPRYLPGRHLRAGWLVGER